MTPARGGATLEPEFGSEGEVKWELAGLGSVCTSRAAGPARGACCGFWCAVL